VRAGGGSRWAGILDFLEVHAPNIVVLAEWRTGKPSQLEGWLSSKAMNWAFANDGATKNGVLVASDQLSIAVTATPRCESPGTLLRVQFDSWTMLACYFPNGDAKAKYFDVCETVAKDCGPRPLLIVGDLNTGNQLVDKTPSGVKYACSERFDRLSQKEGLVDLWRRTHGPEAREWTWRTKQNGFRLDHAFGNQSFVDKFNPTCQYDHRPREGNFSDHSAVVISLES